ncbi:MAG: hypothetical protein HY736_00390 [Verrucomicrobia bacterium]|nr:hypothetical protein [Verrucomicrobiota bacterium]
MTTNAIQNTETKAAPQGEKPNRLNKLGVDVHWREYVVVGQIDGASPQPSQRFSPEAFVAWVAKHVKLADEVHCCYEAGPFGFVLHRRPAGLAARNLVVRPCNRDEYGKKVRTNRRDTLALLSWQRFKNRRQDASYTWLVPNEDSSGVEPTGWRRSLLIRWDRSPRRRTNRHSAA